MAAAVVAESGVFDPEMLAIRYQLNLMELARKLKTRREPRGQPCTNNTYNIWRDLFCMLCKVLNLALHNLLEDRSKQTT